MNVLLLIGAGLLAGTMNAIAGGGSFVSFPALVFAGVPSVAANASSTVALFPGTLTSAWAYRHHLRGFGGVSLRALLIVSLAGGLLGAILLLVTPQATFDAVIPWLLLLATLALGFGREVGAALRRVVHIRPGPVLLIQFVLAIYGGYFGGAVGIMMMAAWSLLDTADLKAMSPARVLLVSATNTIAVICFIVAGAVWWPETLVMLVAAAVGGYAGARLALLMHPRLMRVVILLFTAAMTAVFFLRTL